MTSYTAGVKLLIRAEKRAGEKIAEARKMQYQYLKRAREEAMVEIEKYKQLKIKGHEEFESRYLQGVEQDIIAIETDSAKKLEEMKYWVAESKSKLIDLLVQKVFEAVPVIHRNFHRLQEAQSQSRARRE